MKNSGRAQRVVFITGLIWLCGVSWKVSLRYLVTRSLHSRPITFTVQYYSTLPLALGVHPCGHAVAPCISCAQRALLFPTRCLSRDSLRFKPFLRLYNCFKVSRVRRLATTTSNLIALLKLKPLFSI